MAFPRSPTIHRDERLDLQKLPRGRFSLGDLCDSAMSRQETCRSPWWGFRRSNRSRQVLVCPPQRFVVRSLPQRPTKLIPGYGLRHTGRRQFKRRSYNATLSWRTSTLPEGRRVYSWRDKLATALSLAALAQGLPKASPE